MERYLWQRGREDWPLISIPRETRREKVSKKKMEREFRKGEKSRCGDQFDIHNTVYLLERGKSKLSHLFNFY